MQQPKANYSVVKIKNKAQKKLIPTLKQFKRKEKLAAVIKLVGIELYREERLVLKNVNLAIHPGEHWVMLGPNGSGKSSILSVLQGILWPLKGRIEVLGRKFGESDLTEMRRFIGFVGNEIEPEFPNWQTVLEIVLSGSVGTVGLKFDKPTSADIRRAKLLLKQTGIPDLETRPFAFLSQGQRRLVTIARALMVKPGLLILDEPGGGLDPVAREDFLEKLSLLMKTKNGPVILYVTHHVEEIIPAFTHCLFLKNGQVMTHGKVENCMKAQNLTSVFGREVRVQIADGRYSLRLAP